LQSEDHICNFWIFLAVSDVASDFLFMIGF
jgi:hypothetical protein